MWVFIISVSIVVISLLLCLSQERYFRKQRHICQQQKQDCEASEEILRQIITKGH